MNAAEICYRSCPYQFNCDEFCHNYDPPFPHNLQHYVSPPSEAADYSTLLIIIFVIVISCLLLSCAVKCCSEDAASEDRTRQANNTEEDHDHTHNSIDHTGHARSVGLEESVISSIPVYKYKRGGGITKGTECPVCLNEYRESEDLRLLPLCNHAFHLPCIDTWLKSHTNCPSCRTSIVSNSVTVENSVSL